MNKRKAILISGYEHNGSVQQEEGFKKDLKEHEKHLLSKKGGAWHNEEIILLYNPSKKELQDEIRRDNGLMILYIAYSGHGFSRKSNEDFICLKDGYKNIVDLKGNAERHLMFFDSCRTILKEDKMDLSLESFSMSTDKLWRKKYEDKMLSTERGVVIVFSCSKTEAAGDNSNGGYFSQSLFSVCSKYDDQDIKKCFDNIKKEIKKFPTTQNPEYNGGRRIYHFPYIL